MEGRFRTFQHLLLASMKAQTDPNGYLIVLTSDMIPVAMQACPRAICAEEPRVTVEVTAARDVDAGFLPVFDRLGQSRQVQFRIDDDDCLAVSFVDKLQKARRAMKPYRAWSFFIAKGLVATFYGGEAPQAYTLERPFWARARPHCRRRAGRASPRFSGSATSA